MGIALSGLIALLDLHKRYGSFDSTVQIGRQGLFVGEHERARADDAVRSHGLADSLSELIGSDVFADEHLLPALGAVPIVAADASNYEGATIVHDFNEPIPPEFHGRFDTLIDFGSLEHIFNVPVAITNMMKMVKLGGRISSIAPANNWLGHGLYQIGPELPFRVFQPANGFETISVRLVGSSGSSIELTDQGAVGIRNEIGMTNEPMEVITIARKVADIAPFRRWPQQGDYASAWEQSAKG